MKAVICVCLCVLAVVLAVPVAVHHQKEFEPLSDEIVNFVNSAQRTWRAGHNGHFKGKTAKFVKNLMGVKHIPGFKLPTADIRIASSIPDSFDSRTNWPNCASIKMVRDQGDCGSCWAFGAAEAMSDRWCIATQGQQQPLISAEDLLSCCKLCGDGCNGGEPGAAWEHFKLTGLVTGGLFNTTATCQPYTIKPCNHHDTGRYQPCGDSIDPTPHCAHSCIKQYNISYSDDKHHGKSSYGVSADVATIQSEIMAHGPVEAAFTVFADFPTYKSGVYTHTTGSALGGHAVKIIGWGVDSGVDYWIVANSWNEDWGMGGFFWIRRGTDECGIESEIVAGLPRV